MNKYTERKLIASWISTVVVLLILGFMINTAYACEPHAYLTVGAGKQGEWVGKNRADNADGWDGEDAIAAMFTVGYRAPVQEWLWLGAEAGHHSHWDQGCPQDCDEGEDFLDYGKIYLELRLY